jgi:cytochrome bd-type quinol oxidase subunit 2
VPGSPPTNLPQPNWAASLEVLQSVLASFHWYTRDTTHGLLAAWVMLSAAAVVTIAAPLLQPYIARHWLTVPDVLYLAVLPAVAVGAFAGLWQVLQHGFDRSPFLWSLVIFATSFVGLAVSLYPYRVPPVMTLAETASSSATPVLMLLGIGALIPVMLACNGCQYLVFRGKITREPPEFPASVEVPDTHVVKPLREGVFRRG